MDGAVVIDVVVVDVLPDSIVADDPAAAHPGCDCRLVAFAVDITENEETKRLDDVKCRVTTLRAAAMRRFLVIIVFGIRLVLFEFVLETSLLYAFPFTTNTTVER